MKARRHEPEPWKEEQGEQIFIDWREGEGI
jgi:hypothetical protein